MVAANMENEALIRVTFFLVLFLFFALWEVISPRRALTTSKRKRWFVNIAIAVINSVALRLISGIGAYSMALTADTYGWGLFNNVGVPYWTAVLVSVILLDFTIYLQHFVFHLVPILWRLHMVHHTDLDIDVTSGTRFHPVEILLSMGIKIGVVFLLGAPALAILIFEIILNGTSMFNHSNISIPVWMDRIVRLFIVTPDMHRVHHSIIVEERNSNFGFNLSLWDRILGTYRSQPEAGHEMMVIGLKAFRDGGRLRLLSLLRLPFTARGKAY